MTKWARIRRRKERQRAEAEERQRPKIQNGEDVIQPEKTSENIQQKTETKKPEHTQIQTQKPIISQIPRYVYLEAFFALLRVGCASSLIAICLASSENSRV